MGKPPIPAMHRTRDQGVHGLRTAKHDARLACGGGNVAPATRGFAPGTWVIALDFALAGANALAQTAECDPLVMLYMTNGSEADLPAPMCVCPTCTRARYARKCDQAMTRRDVEQYYDFREAAKVVGVSVDTIRRRLRGGEFPRAIRGSGSNAPWRVPLGDLIAAGLRPISSANAETSGPPSTANDSGQAEATVAEHLAVLREVVAVLERQIAALDASDRRAGVVGFEAKRANDG